MQVKRNDLSPTKVKLTLSAEQSLLDEVKHSALQQIAKEAKIQGFRPGKAPLSVVEKSADQQILQSEVLQQAVNRLYYEAVTQDRLRPVSQPEISITKFVPFSQLEVIAEVEVVGEVKLPDYKKVKATMPEVKVGTKDVNGVIEDLRKRMSDKKAVSRAAKSGDEALIDFKGTDAKTGEAINGAAANDFELVLGSNSFIPGFEDKLIGAETGQDKKFTLTFPKDYGVAALQNRQVKFEVKVKAVNELSLPGLDDKFAAKAGPFKSVEELKSDIKKQLIAERQKQADQQYENELLETIAKRTKVDIPASLIDEEIDRQTQQLKQNLVYRGQTWNDYLKAENLSEESYRETQKDAAELRVKAGLALSEIAAKEDLSVSQQETDLRLQLLKGQYKDPSMQAELDKPETRQEVTNRLLTEKTVGRLVELSKK